jgi:hypothetical protein
MELLNITEKPQKSEKPQITQIDADREGEE